MIKNLVALVRSGCAAPWSLYSFAIAMRPLAGDGMDQSMCDQISRDAMAAFAVVMTEG